MALHKVIINDVHAVGMRFEGQELVELEKPCVVERELNNPKHKNALVIRDKITRKREGYSYIKGIEADILSPIFDNGKAILPCVLKAKIAPKQIVNR